MWHCQKALRLDYLCRNKQQCRDRNAKLLESKKIKISPQAPSLPLLFQAAPQEVQAGQSERVLHPRHGAILEQVSRELGHLRVFQEPRATQSHGWPYLPLATVPLRGEHWLGRFSREVSSTHFEDPTILSLQSTGQTSAAPTSHTSPMVTIEAGKQHFTLHWKWDVKFTLFSSASPRRLFFFTPGVRFNLN